MRRGSRYQSRLIKASVAVALSVGPSHVLAQQQQQQQVQPSSPVTGQLGLTTNVTLDTNPGLSATPSGSRLRISEIVGLDVTTENRNNILRFSVSGRANYRLGGSGNLNLSSPRYSLSYSRSAKNAQVDLGGSFRQTDVSTAYDIDPTSAVFLVPDSGTLALTGFNANLDTGLNAPLGFSFGVDYSGVDYEGTTNPALFDSITVTYDAAANMRLSPVTQATLSAGLVTYDDSALPTATSSVAKSFGLSLSHELRRALMLDANFGVTQTEFLSGVFVGTRTGTSAGLAATQTLPRGDVFARVNFDDTGPTTRADLTFGHNLNLPTGSLSASLTAAKVEGYGTRILGNASYSRQLADATIDISLGQSITTNLLDEDVLNTQFGVSYDQQVTQSSNLNVALNIARIEDAGAGAAQTQNRATLTASYAQSLTPEWDMTVGYSYRFYSDDTPTRGNSNALFLNLTRNIDFGF